MALTKDQVEEMVSRRAAGESRKALAEAFSVSEQTVMYHEKRAVKAAPDPERPTDDDLGIGEEDAPQPDALSVLMANPDFAKVIDAAVAARLAQMSAPVAQADNRSEDFKAFTATLTHLIEIQSMQQAGYVKPIPAAEIDRRAAGLIEMKALLEKYEAAGDAPLYLLGDFFFECTNALSFEAGQQIRTYLPPAEHFVPQNEAARKVYAAMLQWIGGHTPHIGDLVEAAERESRIPVVGSALVPQKKALVEAIDAPKQDMGRKRVAGTIVPERHGAATGQPLGPVFVGADAVAA